MLIRGILLFTLFTAIINTASPQSGLYYAENNYNNRLTNYQIPCPKELLQQELFDFYSKKYILLSKAEAIKKFKKKDIWGYRDCQGFNYKIDHGIHYKILEDDALIMFSLNYVADANFRDFKRGFVSEFYFSKDISSPIELLNLDNLKKVYKDNNTFIQNVESYLKTTHPCLHCYDDHDKTYIVNEMLKETLSIK